MFSTVKTTSVSSAIAARPFSNPRTYSRCQRNGGGRNTPPGPPRPARFVGRRRFSPRVTAPHPLSEQQVRRVYGHDGELVVVLEPAQHVGVLAHRVGVDHHLDA